MDFHKMILVSERLVFTTHLYTAIFPMKCILAEDCYKMFLYTCLFQLHSIPTHNVRFYHTVHLCQCPPDGR